MNTIKFTSKTTLKLNNVKYKAYLIGDLPPSFGFKERFDGQDDDGNDKFKKGIDQWFNYKGLTWVIDKDHWSKML
ncbi:MAG: hypothetical protein QGI18_10080 [Candidatus Marinimicrobia bacterium]|jgi:hypothetical protein|nr:hypothetical protein [Candidatus Neomarinimicrobiota bacterium]